MLLRKKKIIFIIITIIILFFLIFIIKKSRNIATFASVNNVNTIIVDAGHGGFDGGAVAHDGTVEKNINLKIALTLSQFLKQNGFKVIMTRENDISTDDVETNKITSKKKSDMKNRLNLMKDYPDAVFVSIHLNKFTTSSANGTQIFYSTKDDESKNLADNIQKSIVSKIQPENDRVNKPATSSTYLLHNATIPAVLVECGFISNKAELEKLKDEQYQKDIAFCICCGITDYYSK